MRIEFDYQYNDDGSVFGSHTVDTHETSVVVTLVGLQTGRIAMEASGWGVISKHPLYHNKTRFEVVKAEIIRLEDPDGKKALGL